MWEYKVLLLAEVARSESKLSAYGKEGWELASVVVDGNKRLAYLKRAVNGQMMRQIMNTEELMASLEKGAGDDEVLRAALGFIQKTIGVLNSLPNGQQIRAAIENPAFFIESSNENLDSTAQDG